MTDNTKHKPGYKKTALGWIPEEWEAKMMMNISKRIMVGIASAATHAYRETGIILFRNQNIKEGYLDDSDVLYIDEKYEQIHRNKRLEEGDLLIARTGYPGTACLVPPKYQGTQSFTTLIVRPDSSLVESTFLCFYVNSPIGQGFFESNQIGGGQKNVNAGTLESMPIPLPPLPEQRAIAEVLGCWDKAIGTLSALIAQKQARKKWLMQMLLTGKRRLPGFEGEWKRVRLGDLFDEVRETNDGGIHPVLTISARLGLISQDEKFDRVIAGDSLSKYTLMRKGDFAYNKGNSKLYEMGCIYLLDGMSSAVVPFVYICFRPEKDKAHDLFYKFWFMNHGLDKQLKTIITSGARGDGLLNVSRDDFFALKVPLPKLPEQEAIGKALEACEKEIELMNRQLELLKEQKKGLMQELLTGRKRINIENLKES